MPIRPVYRAEEALALDLFERVLVVHLAGTDAAGAPLIRTLHPVLVDGALYFHGGDHGDKLDLVGASVAVSAEEIVARIPSYFVDPRIACPATTYYVSAHARGVVERVTDLDEKTRVLDAFMTRHQPEGGHLPLLPQTDRYRGVIASLLVARVRLSGVVAKQKLGQNRSRQQIERVVLGLWRRGRPGDLEAIDRILAVHPDAPEPPFLRGPHGTRLSAALGDGDVEPAVRLLRNQYWTMGESDSNIARALRGSAAWVGAREARTGQLVATGRAIADGSRHAYIADIAVAEGWRGRGVGTAVVRFLLDHPRVRDVACIRLGTRTPAFYEPFGFASEHLEHSLMRRLATAPAAS